MTKAQREKAERLMLKQMLDSNPRLKEIIDNMIDNPKPELVDAIQPIIEEKLEKARTEGILIGWNSFAMSAYENVKNMENIDEIKSYFQKEQKKMEEKLNLNIKSDNE